MKRFKLLLILGVILTIFGCSDSNDSIDFNEVEEHDHVNSKGLPLCSEDHDSEGHDIEKRQTTWNAEVPFEACDAENLFVLVDLSDCNENTLWECAVQNAIAAYDNLPGNIGIGMTMITNENQLPPGETVNITIDCNAGGLLGAGGGQTFARGTTDGISSVEIGTDFENNWPCAGQAPNCCQMQKIVMHELGHALGFGHTEGGGAFTWIAGTPTGPVGANNDPLSVFNTSATDGWCTTTCGFTAGDLTALATIYPPCTCPLLPRVFITGPSSLCIGDDSEVCIDLGDGADVTTTVTLDGINVNLTGDCFPVSFTNTGVHTVNVISCYTDCPEMCTEKEFEIRVFNEEAECFCVCEAQENYSSMDISWDKGKLAGGKIIKSNIEEWKFPVDCCDPRPCSEIVPGWWDEYLVDRRECFKKEDDCTPPSVGLSGPSEICVGVGYENEICIAGSFNSTTTWSSNSGTLFYSSSKCRNFVAYTPGTYTITVEVCSIEDGEGQVDCCRTLTKTVVAVECEVECYCECKDGQDGHIVELIYDCDEVGDCWDIFYEDDIYDCVQKTR